MNKFSNIFNKLNENVQSIVNIVVSIIYDCRKSREMRKKVFAQNFTLTDR